MKTLLLLLLLPLFAFADCFSAHYTLPVKDELKEFANYELSNVQFVSEERGFQLSYQLPLELTGMAIRQINLIGTKQSDGSYIAVDEAAGHRGTCMAGVASLSCQINYGDLKFAEMDTEKFLAAKFADFPTFLAGKIAAFHAFSTDSVGVVELIFASDFAGGSK